MNSPENTSFGRFLLKWSVVYIAVIAFWIGSSTVLSVRAVAVETLFIVSYVVILMVFFTNVYDDDATSHNIDTAALLGAVILSLVLIFRGGFRATIGLTAVAILFAARIASDDVRTVLDSNMTLFKSLLVLLPSVSVYLL